MLEALVDKQVAGGGDEHEHEALGLAVAALPGPAPVGAEATGAGGHLLHADVEDEGLLRKVRELHVLLVDRLVHQHRRARRDVRHRVDHLRAATLSV
eukprot:3308833-Rhodomonas_salina.1